MQSAIRLSGQHIVLQCKNCMCWDTAAYSMMELGRAQILEAQAGYLLD